MISDYALESGRIAVKRTRHGLLMFNRNDTIIGRSVDRYGEWCEDEIRLLRPAVGQGATVLDVGANIGTHALALAALVGPTGHVVAFEPQPLVFNILAANMALNGADHVRCMNAAVGIGGGMIAVPRTPPDQPANFGNLSLRGPGTAENPAGGPTDAVPLIAIDELDLPGCNLIKADVQGMEPEVIRSASATIARCRPLLYLECDEVHYARELIGLVLGHDYDIYWHHVAYFSAFNFYDNPENLFADYRPAHNLICLPREKGVPVNGLDACRGEDDNCQRAYRRVLGQSDETLPPNVPAGG